MKLYINTRKMTFDEDIIEHEIIVSVTDVKHIGYDLSISLPSEDEFIKDVLKVIYKKDKDGRETDEIEGNVFLVREQDTWHSFPLYEIVDGKIRKFDYTKYQYFADTDRRVILGKKISNLYNIFSEFKIQRKTLIYIMDTLNIEYPDSFRKYNDKIEAIINRNPK